MDTKTKEQPYNSLLTKILATRSKESAMLLVSRGLLVLSCIALAILIASFVEYLANGDTAFRTFLVVAVGAISIAAIIFAIPNLLRVVGIKGVPTVNEIALRIGKYYPTVKDKLGNAIQLVANAEKAIGSSKTLIAAEAEAVYNDTKKLDFDVIIDKKNYNKILILFLASMFLTVGTFTVSEGMSEALFRIKNYSMSFLPPAPFEITLLTKEQTLLRGTKTEIIIAATGQAPDYVKLYVKEENQKNYDEFRLKKDGENLYKFEIASIKQNISFYGEAQWLTSAIVTDIGNFNVVDRPMIRSLAGTLRFPAYTKLAPREINEQTADIAALVGSNVDFTITANKKLKNAYIVFEKTVIDRNDTVSRHSELVSESPAETLKQVQGDDVLTHRDDVIIYPLKITDSKASGGFRVSQNGFYYFVIEDFDGEKNVNPIKYSVVALSDGSPSIALLFPTTDVQVTEQAILPIKVAISDDYGFSGLKLHYRLAASRYSSPDRDFSSISIPINSPEQIIEIAYVWDMNKINIVPEDIYEFYLEVADNNLTPQTARTQTLMVRLPSLEEVSREADFSQNQINKELENIKKETEQLKKNIEEAERELRKKSNDKELDWKQKKQIEDILQKQSQLQDKMQQLSEQVEQTAQQLQQNNMLSQETMQKYQELQKLMQEVRSPQLDQLRQMQKDALEQMSPDELRKAMEQAKFDEDRFRESIERTMEILKRMQAEQKTDALTKRAEELKHRQDILNQELNKTNDQNKMNELAKLQDHLQKDLQNLSNDLKDLEKLMQEIGDDMPLQEMKDAMDALDNQGLQEDMESASKEMKSGEKNKADKSQKSASKKMDDFAQKMRDMKQKMQDDNNKEVIRKLQKAIDNLAKISKQQENAKNQSQRSDANSTRVPEISEAQANISENLQNLVRDLVEIGGKSFAITQEMANSINDAMRSQPNIMDQLTDRRMQQAARMQTEAMKNMNSALAQMQQSLNEMQNDGGCENGDNSCSGDGSCGQGNCGQGGQGGKGQGRGKGSGFGMGAGQGTQQMLQQMAAEQQALNQQMQQMMGGSGQGGTNEGRYSQEQQAGMRRIAEEQNRIGKSMEELAKEQEDLGGKPQDRNDGNKLSNELTKMAEELKEITADISRGRITPETLQRQERILSRMLDATRSVNDRDFERNRESQRGIDILRNSPSGIDLSTQEGKTRAMQELMQSIKKGYTKDYEQIIRQYFEAIQRGY
jgi:hypothetical protein